MTALSAQDTTCTAPPLRRGDVYVFATCLIDLMTPQGGLDAIRLLEKIGYRVHFPAGQSCCGQPAYTSGYPEAARQVAAAQLGLFPQPWPIVVLSGSCGGMMHKHWPALFAGTKYAATAEAVARRVVEFATFVHQVAQVEFVDCDPASAPETLALHTSCSARREMQVHESDEALLQGLNVNCQRPARATECCGFGGTFSLRQPEISSAMAADKAAAVQATGAKTLVAADCGCLLNIAKTLEAQGADVQAEYIATTLLRHSQGQHRARAAAVADTTATNAANTQAEAQA
jgi:L-lactate dehydrogenase complex protein LldE